MKIKSDAMYKRHLRELQEHEKLITKERERFKDLKLDKQTIELAIQPMVNFVESLKEDLDYYLKIKKGNFESAYSFEDIGKLLIEYRVYKGWTQEKLGEKMGTSKNQVSRDEKNEYFGASLEKISAAIKALEIDLNIKININI